MKESDETWNQWLLGHRPLSRFFQIDRLIQVLSGSGTQTTSSFYLPRGRYTVFVHIDRDHAVNFFEFTSDQGFRVRDDDWLWDQMGAPLVQKMVPAGTYQIALSVRTPSVCWRAQVVLNSMLSWEAPPAPWHQRLAPPSPVALGSGVSAGFHIPQTGDYAVELNVDGFDGTRGTFPDAFCPFRLTLCAADGHTVRLAEGGDKTASWPSWTFLGAGDWTVVMETSCVWSMTLKPKVGPSGGGARWF